MIDAAVRAVREACAVCRAVRGEVGAITKGDNSPVTIADFASQAVVARRLRETLGPITLLAEEGSAYLRDQAHAPQREAALSAARLVWPSATAADMLDAIDLGAGDFRRGAGDGYWTLDPIDGTKGFLRGGQYAVCLAYVSAPASAPGKPVFAALGCPNLPEDLSAPFEPPDERGMIYVAWEGGGVWSASADGESDGELRRVSRRARPHGAPPTQCRSVDASHSDHPAAARVMAMLGGAGAALALDSQCKYAVVARGQADIYLRIPGRRPYVERVWDHAPGALIATEAGCAVSDIHGKPLDFGHGRGLETNRGIICCDADLHADAVRAVAAVVGQTP